MRDLLTKIKCLGGRVLAESYVLIYFHKMDSDWMNSRSYENWRGEG